MDGRVAMVTGAAQGFGRAIALRLLDAGASVALIDHRKDVIAVGGSAGERALGFVADVTDESAVQSATDAVVDRFGRLDILVNNAGTVSNKLVASLDAAEVRRVMDVNLVAATICARAAVDRFRRQGDGGTIVNISSIDALHPTVPGLAHYDASKHAIWGYTQSLALELGAEGIRVNAVAPGPARTEGIDELVADRAPGGIDVVEQWDELVKHIPMGRLVEGDDVARAVLYLVSDLSDFVTGAQLVVDGGFLLR
jgi:2-deoxy-D-gluconate 3-dehydrogenase